MAQLHKRCRLRPLQVNCGMQFRMQNADEELTPKKGRERKQNWAEAGDELGCKPDKALASRKRWSKYYSPELLCVGWNGWTLISTVVTGYTLLGKGKVAFCIWEELTAGDHLLTALAPCSWAARPSAKRDLGSSVAPCLPH